MSDASATWNQGKIGPPPPPPPLKNRMQRRPPPPAVELLDEAELSRFKNLLVFAKTLVEGYFTGRHRSPDFGSTSEFADYRAYVPGDSIEHLDWKVYARTKKLFVRLYEDETDMSAYLMVDVSGSMGYKGAGAEGKFLRSARIAAAIAYLMHKQGDKFSLTLFNDRILNHTPVGGSRRHLHQLLLTLQKQEQAKPGGQTSVDKALEEAVGVLRKKGRLIVISDFITSTDQLFESLSQFVHRGFEVLLLHVMDPWEMHLPQVALAQFVDMETAEEIQAIPEEIRAEYRKRMDTLTKDLSREATRRQIRYSLLGTEHPYLEAIEAYLGFRNDAR